MQPDATRTQPDAPEMAQCPRASYRPPRVPDQPNSHRVWFFQVPFNPFTLWNKPGTSLWQIIRLAIRLSPLSHRGDSLAVPLFHCLPNQFSLSHYTPLYSLISFYVYTQYLHSDKSLCPLQDVSQCYTC